MQGWHLEAVVDVAPGGVLHDNVEVLVFCDWEGRRSNYEPMTQFCCSGAPGCRLRRIFLFSVNPVAVCRRSRSHR